MLGFEVSPHTTGDVWDDQDSHAVDEKGTTFKEDHQYGAKRCDSSEVCQIYSDPVAGVLRLTTTPRITTK